MAMDKKYTCLIVEDDTSFSFILEKIIRKIPEVEWVGTCTNTNDAAIAIQRKKPDILLLDINIDGLDGPEILELSNHKPKTIVISSHPEKIMDDYEIEFSHFIQKPLTNPESLVDILKWCVDSM